MSAVRKKRNFKDLHLPSTPLATGAAAPSASSSFSTATAAGGPSASTAAGGARVQKEGSSAAEQGAASTSQGDARNSSLRTASSSARSSTGGAASSSTTLTTASAGGVGAEGSEADYHDRLSEKLASFGLGYKLELKNEDLKFLSELGSGNSGTVTKVCCVCLLGVGIGSSIRGCCKADFFALITRCLLGTPYQERHHHGEKGRVDRCEKRGAQADSS